MSFVKYTVSAIMGVLISSAVVLAANASPTPKGNGPCAQIVTACQAAGFVKGEYKVGKGLWRDCVDPIVQGKQVNSAIPLPAIDPAVVTACKAKHPKFGAGKVGT